ncbi:hypothetical protein AVEN_88948-1 [Araneus ventricosus]|uniref:Uncharacterized protein n=1 Tax=Araneus ventricosus TaxID=182803 RepID=A0A4Y2DIL8_ARAVE|nr:hypothetical protein AVEN_88948-1 [Araneus ventricosus]
MFSVSSSIQKLICCKKVVHRLAAMFQNKGPYIEHLQAVTLTFFSIQRIASSNSEPNGGINWKSVELLEKLEFQKNSDHRAEGLVSANRELLNFQASSTYKCLPRWLLGGNRKRSCPDLPRHTGPLIDTRCNSSSTEAGVLIAHHQATAQPFPKEVRTITGAVNSTPIIAIPEARTRFLIRRPLIRVLAMPPMLDTTADERNLPSPPGLPIGIFSISFKLS